MKNDDVYNWIAGKGETIEKNPFFDACIDAAIENVHNVFIDGQQIVYDDMNNCYKAVVTNFVSTAKQLLANCIANDALIFRDVPLKNYYHRRNELLSQLDQLASLY